MSLLLFALLAATWIVQRSWFDPSVEFLPPGAGPWMVHPGLPIRVVDDPPTPPVEFSTTLTADEGSAPVIVKIRAFREAEILLGDWPLSLSPSGSWKKVSAMDLRPFLGADPVDFSVVVRNPTGPPALSIQFEEGVVTRLPWRVRIQGARGRGVLAVDTAKRFGSGGPWGWAGLVVVGTWIALLWGRRRVEDQSGIEPTARYRIVVGVLVAALTLGVFLADLHNAARYPTGKGYDAWGHEAYIQHLASGSGLPDATDGWQMYQPPLYYFLASTISDTGGSGAPKWEIAPGQILSCAAHAALVLIAFGFSRVLFPGRSPLVGLAAAASVAALPAGWQLAPMVTNEPFAGSLIAGAMLGLSVLSRSSPKAWHGVALGVVLSAAALSKFTGVLALAAGAVTWMIVGLRAPRNVRAGHWKRLVVLLAVVASLAGWYYLRNQRTFGDPFVGNWDLASGFHYEQVPGYRDLPSLFRFGPVFSRGGLRQATSRSIPEGFFASMWADPHDFYLGEGIWPRAQRSLLWLGLVPTALGFAGFTISWARSGRTDGSSHFAVVFFSILVVVGLSTFSLELPFFSTAKAFFAWSLFPILAAWSVEALARLWIRFRWLSLPWLIASAAWILIALVVFAIGGPGISGSA